VAEGIDFDKNGVLYGVGFDGLWKIDPVTGVSQHVASTPSLAEDIDIDSNNTLRLVYASLGLQQFSLSSGVMLEQTYFQYYSDSAVQTNFVVHR
jgi:hypothetical protein